MLGRDILVYVLNARPRHEAVLDRFDRVEPQDMVVSSITFAELRYGIEKSQRREANRRALDRVLRALNVLAFDSKAAETYGSVRAALEAAGTPIGPLDTLIAAHALALNLTLVTSTLREFSKVRSLRVESWVSG